MTGAVLRAEAWPAVAGLSGVAVVVGGCGAAFPAAATPLFPFPTPGVGGPSSDPVWWTVLAVCAVATAISVAGRSLPQWRASVVIPRRPAPYGYAGPGLALAAASFVIFILRQLRPWR